LKGLSASYIKEKNNEILQLNNDIKDFEKKIEEKNNELNIL
jgi:cell division protein FtsL